MTETLAAQGNPLLRVGARQYATLIAAARVYPKGLTAEQVRKAVGSGNTPAHVRLILAALTGRGLLVRVAPSDIDCAPPVDRWVITELGLECRLGKYGNARSLRPRMTAPAA